MTATFVEPMSAIVLEPVDRVPATETLVMPEGDASAQRLVEEILKRPAVVDARLRDPRQAGILVPRLIAISLVGFTMFCLAASVILSLSPELPAGIPASGSTLGDWLSLFAAYDVGLLLAIGICLPSFYFYTLLAGVRITMLETVAHALKGHAVAAIVLVGMLPVYVAITLGLTIFGAPDAWTHAFDYLLLTLPFQAGIAGAISLYRGFTQLCDTMPEHFARRRHCFLRRLLISWCGCMTVITPLVIYTIWVSLAQTLS